MPGTTPSAAALAVAAKYEDLATKHNNALAEADEIHDIAVEEILPQLLDSAEGQDDPHAEERLRAFLDDRATMFRFYRRARYSVQGALSLLSASLSWRLSTDLDSLSLASLHPLYVSPPAKPPLFWCNTKCKDKLGRPVGVISLQSLERASREDGPAGLEECREYIAGCMESVRRYLANLYGKATTESRYIDTQAGQSKPLQMVIIFSLQSSGMANLELELLPFLLDLLKNHFPGMVGAVYITHYGWVHSGMWGLAKRVLPQQALAKIFFPSAKELDEHFDLSLLPESLGGEWDITMNEENNNVMRRFARPGLQGHMYNVKGGGTTPGASAAEDAEWDNHSAPPSPRGISGSSSPAFGRSSRAQSRSGSFDSLVDQFFSSSNTPWQQTPGASGRSTPRVDYFRDAHSSWPASSPLATTLRMTPTAEQKLEQLKKTREGGGNRSRANSDAARRLTADGMYQPGRSPTMSRGVSPNQGRRRAASGLGLSAKSVHFHGTDGHGGGGDDDDDFTSRDAPLSRKGSLRDFRLLQTDFSAMDLSGDTSGSEESDKSGKVGETVKEMPGSTTEAGGFFARWRQNSRGSLSTGSKETRQRGRTKSGEEVITDESDPQSAPSPHLQVPDIEEPPMSGYDYRAAESNHFLSRRSRKFSNLPGHVSPYNASNPFYGYPAYPTTSSSGNSGGGIDRRFSSMSRLHFRRRKRDLLRTLMYLFVLRLLSLHRGVRHQILAVYTGLVRAIRVGGASDETGEDEGWREATQRYNKLRSATNRRQQTGQAHSESAKARQAQPLFQLGFRKRYAFLLLFFCVMTRREWRRRLLLNSREVAACLGLGKMSSAVEESSGDVPALHEDEKLSTLSEGALDGSSLTGLHLRKRLGWK